MGTMAFAVLGFLSPANRGGLMTAMLLLFVFMGVPAGYASAFLHKTLKGTEWKQNIILTSCLFPGIVFLIFFILNFFVFFLLTGTIGFYACYWFVWKIFSAIKVD